jgi:hypothetical protein
MLRSRPAPAAGRTGCPCPISNRAAVLAKRLSASFVGIYNREFESPPSFRISGQEAQEIAPCACGLTVEIDRRAACD